MFEMLDNLDKEDVGDVAYFIVCECPNNRGVLDDEYKEYCHRTYQEFGMSADWEEVWEEIGEYFY